MTRSAPLVVAGVGGVLSGVVQVVTASGQAVVRAVMGDSTGSAMLVVLFGVDLMIVSAYLLVRLSWRGFVGVAVVDVVACLVMGDRSGMLLAIGPVACLLLACVHWAGSRRRRSENGAEFP
jgi:hypothetical protein